MTSLPEAPGAPAVILYRQVDRDDSARTGNEYNYVRIKILTEEGRKHADVEIPYLREQGTIGGLRARTVRPDGSVANFEGKAFDKTIVKAKGVKYLAKTFTLPDVQVGSIIEYHYTYNMHRELCVRLALDLERRAVHAAREVFAAAERGLSACGGAGRSDCRRGRRRRSRKLPRRSCGWSRRIFRRFRWKTTCRRRTS